MVERATARRLLGIIEQRLQRLDELADTPLQVSEQDAAVQDRVERNFEIAIQACIDLGLHLLADAAGPAPETNRAVFSAMAQHGWIDHTLATRLAAMAGFRNVLAHGYASLNNLELIREYLKQLSTHLRATGVLP